MRSFKLLASRRWCLLALLAVGCAHSSAGPASALAEDSRPDTATPEASSRKEQKVRRLMALTGAEETSKRMMEAMSRHFEQTPNMPPGFMEKFREVVGRESIVDLLVPVYLRHYSEEDLDAAIAFHESPAGQRFLAAQPRVMQEAMQVGEQWGLRLAEQTLRALAEDERPRRVRPVRGEGQQL